VCIADRAFGDPFDNATKLFVALACFAASVHYFVLTAWHTVDGLFLASIGVWVLIAWQHKGARIFGYLLIATTYLCKQSFLFVAPLTVLLLGDWREKKYWLTTTLPAVGYCAYLLVTGSLSEAVLQMASQTGFVSTGVLSYLNYGTLLGILTGFCSTFLLSTSSVPTQATARLSRYGGAALLIAMPAFFIGVGLYRGSLGIISFGIFGMVVGAVLYLVSTRTFRDGVRAPVVLIALLLAWSASLSVGYNFPALLLGPLFAILAAFVYSLRGSNSRFLRATLVIAGVAILMGFSVARPHYIYREQPSGELTKSLDGVLPGGRLIYTNPNTYDFLVDLNEATGGVSSRNMTYAIVPDVPGYWVKSRQTNPLPVDWPQPVELGSQHLIDRVTRDLEAERGDVVVLVQKVHAFYLAEGFVPLDEDQYAVVRYVRENFEKTDETEFFELYE
jgi:hypothetical protein